MPDWKKFNEEYRLLLKICNMLLRIGRNSISVDEMANAGTHFGFEDGEILVNKLIEYGLFKIENEALVSVNDLEGINIEIERYEHDNWALSMREEGVWLPYYQENVAHKEINENKDVYKGKKIRGKIITGIGHRAIVLDNYDFHNFMNEKKFMLKENSSPDGFDLAKEIINEYCKQEKIKRRINL